MILKKYGTLLIVALVVIAAIVTYTMRAKPPDKVYGSFHTIKAYYMHEETGEVTERPYVDVPPLLDPAGKPSIVRAIYYRCDPSDTKKVAYLEKYTDNIRAHLLERIAAGDEPAEEGAVLEGHLVRSPEPGSKWVPITSREGTDVTGMKCNGRPARFVRP